MRRQIHEARYFLYSQAFADGLRTTVAILIPAVAGAYFGFFQTGITLALGALCVSLTDAPGPLLNKRNGMLACAITLFVVGLLTVLAQPYPLLMGLEIVAVGFFFSMFNAYGPRAAAVGSAAILIMILSMDQRLPPSQAPVYAAYVTAGGLWYFLLSYFFSLVRPYRPGQRVLGDCLREIAGYLRVKARFYEPDTDLLRAYRRLVARQVVVHEKQDAVRDLLFKTRQIVQESTPDGRRLVLLFVEAVDLFEDATATYHDYKSLRSRFADTGILRQIAGRIRLLAAELDRLGVAVQTQSAYQPHHDLEQELVSLKAEMDALPRLATESHLVLRKILVNLRRLIQRLHRLNRYAAGDVTGETLQLDHGRFVSHQPLDPRTYAENLTLKSGIFRHALRVALASLLGYYLIRIINYGTHSYWVLLTIAFILKPAFSLTRERNVQRIIGTVSGIGIALAVLLLFPARPVQFGFLVLFMLLTYSFLRINYLAMVLFTTPFVIILFSFHGLPFREVILERLFDTVLGCAIAFGASVLLFPSWEAGQLSTHLQGVMQANLTYLKLLLSGLEGRPIPLLSYKLARKEIYVQTANLSASFQRMLNEPAALQKNAPRLQQFIVLQHLLFSNIAALMLELMQKSPRVYPPVLVQKARKALLQVGSSLERMGVQPEAIEASDIKAGFEGATGEPLWDTQLDYIVDACKDMDKLVAQTFAGNVSASRMQP